MADPDLSGVGAHVHLARAAMDAFRPTDTGQVSESMPAAVSAVPMPHDAGKQQNSGGAGVNTKRSEAFNDGWVPSPRVKGAFYKPNPKLTSGDEAQYRKEKQDTIYED